MNLHKHLVLECEKPSPMVMSYYLCFRTKDLYRGGHAEHFRCNVGGSGECLFRARRPVNVSSETTGCEGKPRIDTQRWRDQYTGHLNRP